MKTFQLLFITIFLLGLTQSCNIIPTPISNEEANATAIAGTLTVLASTSETTISSTQTPNSSESSIDPSNLAPLSLCFVDSSHNLSIWREADGWQELVSTGDIKMCAISTDGSIIAFTRIMDGSHLSLEAINSDGSNPRVLFSREEFDSIPHDALALAVIPFQIEWIPGSHHLAFNTHPIFEGPGLNLNGDLYLVNADSLERIEFLSYGSGGMFFPSPDGQWLAITTPANISIISLDGSILHRDVVTFENVITYSEAPFYPSPIWSPDSNSLGVIIPPQDPLGSNTQTNSFWTIESASGAASLLRTFESYPFSHFGISPDLSSVAYLTQFGDPSTILRQLHLLDLSTGIDTEYTYGSLDFGSWSPDSNRFIYETWEPANSILGQAGVSPMILTDVNEIWQLAWIDENRVIFLNQTDSNWELRFTTVGSISTMIASTPLSDGYGFPIFDISH